MYISTRSKIESKDTLAVLQGLAVDGGLFVDANLSEIKFDWMACLQLEPLDMAAKILGALLPGFDDMEELVQRAYRGKFETDCLTPLVKVGDKFVLELFRGPTSAFKDVALSMLPQLITAARARENIHDETVILTATSGDTGKAALEGFHDVEGTRIIVFYPDQGVSAVQKAQMVSQQGANVRVCAVKGNFDDCQTGVKEAFSKINGERLLAGKGLSLSSANSINIGRLAPQLVYYFIAYAKLVSEGEIQLGDKVDFAVPTGNFGDILAGYYARMLGLPVGTLICASNENNVLTQFINTGVYDRRRDFHKTSSPSMDILVSSNLERLLFYASNGDFDFVSCCMGDLKVRGVYSVSGDCLSKIQAEFCAYSCNELETKEIIGRVWQDNAYLCDPHTAVAMKAAEDFRRERPGENKTVVLSTASPYKFPATVLEALGGDMSGDEFEKMERLSEISGVPIPKNLSGLKSREVLHKDVISKENITDYILGWLEV